MPKNIKMKIAVIGPSNSGKTSFISNFLGKPFKKEYEPTQNYELFLYKFTQNKIQYEVQLWDCGTEHSTYNKHIKSAFYRNCSAALMMFDLSNPNWKSSVPQWLQEAYQFDCYLVYAIGTKKTEFFRKNLQSKSINVEEEKLTSSLLQKHNVQTIDELQINNFFGEYQIKHFYQEATQKVHYSIRNIIVSIQEDKQKLTRSSLAQGRRFDNSVVYDAIKIPVQLMTSVKVEEFEPKEEE